jgi:hypothetical protein
MLSLLSVRHFSPSVPVHIHHPTVTRRLNMWGFVRILQGPSAGGYSHDLFVRGQTELCKNMNRVKIKGTPEKRLKPIRCRNTRTFQPPLSSFLKRLSKDKPSPSQAPKECTKQVADSRSELFATSMESDAKESIHQSGKGESSQLEGFEESPLSIDPLPMDLSQDGQTYCSLCRDLASLLD